MSLIKQLWIGIALLLIITLGGTFTLSLITAKTYLQEQLRLKNIDNATSLALSLSQMDKDPISIELFITAQFDTGHYEYIVFKDPNKTPIVARSFDTSEQSNLPLWFIKLADFNVAPGLAQVQDGWQQYGSILVKSHSRFALDTLWKNARNLFDWFIVATLLSGLIGSFILKYISRPLDIVIQQAEAIGERRFITSSEPKTIEFKRLVRAMNTLSEGVRIMLEKETLQLENLRHASQYDALTGLATRAHFLNILDSKLTREDSNAEGVVAIARIMQLTELNHQYSRDIVDGLIIAIAKLFAALIKDYPGSHAGRLNGSDFIICISTDYSLDTLSTELSQKINFQLLQSEFNKIALPIALSKYHRGEVRQELLKKLDTGLAQAELKGNRAVTLLTDQQAPQQRNQQQWRHEINLALENNQIALAQFPVRQADHKLLHLEAPLRMQFDGQMLPAGYFMPWATRLGLMPQIDLAMLRLSLKELTEEQCPKAINISADALCDAHFRTEALTLLSHHKHLLKNLWIEFSETCVLRHLDEFRLFSAQLRQFGCVIGLEHIGLEFTQFRQLQDVGLHYLKIDSAIVRDIHSNTSNQQFLQSLCQVGHSLGFIMIAEGIICEYEKTTVLKLGVDAVTGPYIN
jgi:EAL domain-containing protein (putative c-di-GMP-specific phosphodiesterase class I)/GGDEF domain-containing protein